MTTYFPGNRFVNRPLLALLLLVVTNVALAERPNFIIFIADDMAWEDCGAYGHPAVRTPNIDALARDGLRFNRAYLTCSSCSPSRCSILTGRYPHNTGAGELHLPLPGTQTMLTKPLKDAGYWTAAVGKWHLGDSVADQVDYRQGSRPAAMGDAWVETLRNRPPNQPFFVWAAHSDPHRAYSPGAVSPPHSPSDVIVPPFLPDTPRVRNDLALYYDEICRFDQHLGMTLEELEKQGVAENTFVLVISDNGRPFPHCKTGVNVPGVRTPFVVRWPAKIQPGGIRNQLISTVDIAPTILDLAGLDPLPSFQGKSLSEAFADSTREIRPYAFAEHNWHDYRAFERSAFDQRYCYVRNWLPGVAGTPPADAVNSPTYAEMRSLEAEGQLSQAQRACMITPRATEFLYDTETDPNCLINLAELPDFQKKLDELRAALDAWQTETEDQFPGETNLTPDGFDRETGERLIKTRHPNLKK